MTDIEMLKEIQCILKMWAPHKWADPTSPGYRALKRLRWQLNKHMKRVHEGAEWVHQEQIRKIAAEHAVESFQGGLEAKNEDLDRLHKENDKLKEALHLILIQRENFTDDAANNIYKLAHEALK